MNLLSIYSGCCDTPHGILEHLMEDVVKGLGDVGEGTVQVAVQADLWGTAIFQCTQLPAMYTHIMFTCTAPCNVHTHNVHLYSSLQCTHI